MYFILYIKHYSEKGSIAINRLVKGSMTPERLSSHIVEGKVRIEFCQHLLYSVSLVGEVFKSSRKNSSSLWLLQVPFTEFIRH